MDGTTTAPPWMEDGVPLVLLASVIWRTRAERLKDMPSIVRRESKETERQSIVRLSREAEAEAEAQNGSEIGHTEPTRSAADSSASSSLSKQVESNGPLFSSDSSSDESDYSTPADGGGGAYPPNWKVSVKRILGARVYARYENGEWYWGNIVRVQGSYREGNLRFGVLFEDGDNLEDLEANHMITEREYINEKREGKDRWPPHPKPKRRKLRRLLDEANGKQPMAEGNDKMAAAGLATSPATNVTSPAMSVTAAILRSNWTGSPRAKKQRLDSESNANATATPMDIKGVLRTPSMAGQSNRPGARSDSKVNGALDASSSHFLVGKDYAFEWTDVWGENKILYGKIMKRADIDSFEVKYSDASRNVLLLMSKKSVFGLPPIIPESEIIKEDQAWGGAACFERKILFRRGPDSVLRNLTREKACTTVIVPDTRHQKLVEYNGMKVPEVTLTVRGFKLVFSVKQSTIPGAGLGVFVKCTSFRKKEGNATDEVPETFELMKGELLDIGVYSPLAATDKKHQHVFNCKAYAFSMRIEQYSFDSPDDKYLFDISDDQTGEPHDTARRHLPMYVNETILGTDTIHAENDPEGNVHYMFGLRYDGDWQTHVKESKKFALRADGETEKELFVNYGEKYEDVRIREGYSTLSQKQQKVVLRRAAKHQREFLLDVFEYEPESLQRCVDFFSTKLIPEHYYGEGGQGKHIDPELRDRALNMSRMFNIRGKRIMDTMAKKRQMASESHESPTVKRYDPSGGIDMDSLMRKINALIDRLTRLSCTCPVPAYTKEMELRWVAEAEEYHRQECHLSSDDGYIESDTDIDEDVANGGDSDSSYEE